jgi:hypothetical protein
MLAVGVATTHPGRELREAGAAHVFKDPAAIDPAGLIGLLLGRGSASR